MNAITIEKYNIKLRIEQTDDGFTVDGVPNGKYLETSIRHAKQLIEQYAEDTDRTEAPTLGQA